MILKYLRFFKADSTHIGDNEPLIISYFLGSIIFKVVGPLREGGGGVKGH